MSYTLRKHSVSRSSAFTLVDLLVVVGVCVFAILIVGCSVFGASELERRTACATHMASIYQGFNAYSVSYQNMFPFVGTPPKPDAKGGHAIGFKEGDRATGKGATLEDNVTANLWAIVNQGIAKPEIFICPGSSETPDTIQTASVQNSHDFASPKNLSYSVQDMYDPVTTVSWNASAGSDWVYMADDNDNDSNATPARHSLIKGAQIREVEQVENSTHHGGQGQNVMYGDGHVQFAGDPFQGPANDNIYARGDPRKSNPGKPPTLNHNDSEDIRDAVLLPIHGNGGVNLANSK